MKTAKEKESFSRFSQNLFISIYKKIEMASTRNKNTAGNYQLEQWSLEHSRIHQSYLHQPNGQAITTHIPGNGLLNSWLPRTQLSINSVDVESFLRGTGTTNLVVPKADVTPQITPLASLSVADRTPLIIPKPLYVEPEQRPLW